MSAMLPVNTMLTSPMPSPVVKLRPVKPDRVNVPLTTPSVTCRLPLPASKSETATRLPLPDENTRAVSSLSNCPLGTVLMGASLMAFTEMATVSASLLGPPDPVLPRSEVRMVRLSAPL